MTVPGPNIVVAPDRHPNELCLAVEDIEHSRTKTENPQTNGICERFNKTLLYELPPRVTFRKRLCATLDQLQADLGTFVETSSVERPHKGRWCYEKTSVQVFLDNVSWRRRSRWLGARARRPHQPGRRA